MKFSLNLILLAFAIIIVASSCKKYLDVNTNPNYPLKVNVSEVLPSAELAIAHVVGNNFQIFGGLWAQHWTQNPNSSQYKTIEQYSPASDDFDRPWRILYADALGDLDFIIKKATEENKFQYVACAKILQAYTYQLLTDNFGDIPFSEALKGAEGILTPKYDSQKDVYTGIIKLLNDGIALIDSTATNMPATDDILLGGDMSKWKRFANTLKLRVYLRLSEVDPATSQSGVQSLSTVQFLSSSEDVQVRYTSAGGNTNPLYSSIVSLSSTQNLVGSSTAIDSMLSWGDERLTVFYTALSNGSYSGIAQGDYSSGTPISSISLPGDITGGHADAASATAPVKLMTGYESLFLQAEAAARGWLPGNAQSLYEQGITASFVTYGLSDTLAPLYYAGPGVQFPTSTVQKKIEAIITQKWVAMCGNSGTEAWTEWRRTGYPSFFTPSLASTIGAGRFPARFLYPSTESTRNPNNPGQKFIYEKVWWDVN